MDNFRTQQAEEEFTAETSLEIADRTEETRPTIADPEHAEEPGDRSLVLASQKLLAQLGYDPGPHDGLPGRKTRRAIQAFQADIHVTVDGAVTPALVLALVDANTHGHVAVSAIAPDGEPRPAYRPGDTYVYSDSTSATIVRVDNDVVVWQAAGGERGASHWNFIRPGASLPLGRSRWRYDVEAAADEIWPLRARKAVTFTARPLIAQAGIAADAPSTAQVWRCGVEGAEQVAVAAGRFDTVRVSCQTSDPIAGQPVERTWFYSPALRHFVRRDERFAASQPIQSVELVAIRLEGLDWPPAARAGLHRALQAALESAAKGERIEWKSSAVETQVTISPTAARQDASSYCRTFVQEVHANSGDKRLYPGLACREVSGDWVIPGAAPGPSPS